jgi:Collagen triple helix repeat (20 copies)
MSQVKEAEVTRSEVEDLKQRVHAVEQAEIKLRHQAVGPRGPQGPTGPAGLKGDTGAQGPSGASGRNGANGSDGVTPSKDSLEALVLELLQEYGVLNDRNIPYAGPQSK